MATFQVIAECAHVTLPGPHGTFVTLLLKGALVPETAPELERLLRDGYVARADGETGGVDADGVPAAAYDTPPPASLTSTPVPSEEERNAEAERVAKALAEQEDQAVKEREAAEKSGTEDTDKRAAAQAKLKEIGEPDGRSSQAVWAEYLVTRGQRYEDVQAVSKAELMKLAEQQKA